MPGQSRKQAPTAEDKRQATAEGKNEETMPTNSQKGNLPDEVKEQHKQAGAASSPTRFSDDVQERTTEGGGKHREVEHPEGYRVGQLVPNEESEEMKRLRAVQQEEADAYWDQKEECPHCHVSDGVRKGSVVCDSCGARIKEDSDSDDASKQKVSP